MESLQLLQNFVSAKLQAQAAKLEADAFEDKSLPIVAMVKKVETYLVKVETAPSEDIKKSIEDIFQGEFLDGFEHLVTAAVNELLGNTLAGEKEFSSFQVVFAGFLENQDGGSRMEDRGSRIGDQGSRLE